MQYGSTVLFVDEVSDVLAFYHRAFGFETKFYDPEFGFAVLDVAGGDIAFASHDAGRRMMPDTYRRPDSGHPESVEIAFYSSDITAAYERGALAAGALSLAAPRPCLGVRQWLTLEVLRAVSSDSVHHLTQRLKNTTMGVPN
ncbi:MAG: hypothetical protein HC808_08050 [Candidatus Competibacteraceae bacterium]|nr:hypothetical protein [Candidatus Competibacteraceae bacterium]